MSSIHFTPLVLMIWSFLIPISITAHTHHCTRYFDKYLTQKNITQCLKLHTLGAQFGWNSYDRSHIDVCVGAVAQSETGWLAWGINPQNRSQMVGTRALIGIRDAEGGTSIDTYNITSETKLGCRLQPSSIDVTVLNKTFEYKSEYNYYIICASLLLDRNMYNTSKLNHVWQVGKAANGNEPLRHPNTLQNVDSTEVTNLASRSSHSTGSYRHRLRVAHGVLNIVGWGTLLPIGVIISRYFKGFPIDWKHWKALHITCQIIGYLIGTSGWIIGLYLGNVSKYFSFPIHALLSNFLFTFATLQMLALRLKPQKKDEYMRYWRMYHHFLGYALLSLIIVNIFRGIGIFTPNHTWKRAYFGLLGSLAFITLVLEIYTWVKFKKAKPKENNATKS
ncbi:cytochrome b561 and DOMON domain-containing protein At4g12980-like [Actinidia eriantha]|uniref:cytochrome b561 and DOMON domain-containing protein At4g12980-like n=1 Tax=Actinidia eriantha TaxID=165200 RepID=UPI0025869FAD|nr:cytochrome b561 and DOMON domain-containing protein At4g12980-like [Actinidia eriantha]